MTNSSNVTYDAGRICGISTISRPGVLVHELLYTPVYTECPAFEHQLDALHILQYRDIL